MNREDQVVKDQIAVNGTDTPELVWVEGIPVGDHLLVHTWQGRWTVTHRPTGCFIEHMRDGYQALRLAKMMLMDGYDIGESYTTQEVEDIRGLAEKVRWAMAERDVEGKA